MNSDADASLPTSLLFLDIPLPRDYFQALYAVDVRHVGNETRTAGYQLEKIARVETVR